MSRVVELTPKRRIRLSNAKNWNTGEKRIVSPSRRREKCVYQLCYTVWRLSRLNFSNLTENVFSSVKIGREPIKMFVLSAVYW